VRRRLLASTLTIAVAILVLFGVPLGVVLDRAVHADAQSRLEREATRVARELGRDPERSARPTSAELERLVPAGDRVLVMSANETIASDPTRVPEAVVATVPGPNGSQVRVESPAEPIDARVGRALLALVLLGVLALGAGHGRTR
jgi:hypothetical protein